MEQNIYFENTHTNAGTIKAGTKGTKLKWTIVTGMETMVEFIRPTCGCTEAEINGNIIKAHYNDSSDASVIQSNTSKSILVTKSLTAYIKDGLPLKVKNARGIETFNEKKKALKLTFTVTVTA